jgi:hypothetical protein
MVTFDLDSELEEDLPELESIAVDTVDDVSGVEESDGNIFLS